MRKRTRGHSAALACLLLILSFGAHASLSTWNTPPGSTFDGFPVNASATFLTGLGTLSITLQNFQVNPTDGAQLISDLEFTLSSGVLAALLSSSSGQEITVNSDGTFNLGGSVATGWGLSSSASGYTLEAAGTSHLLIGPPIGTYSNANSTIAGSGANPFLNQNVSFLLSIPGINSDTRVTGVIFSFGLPDATVPEPATLALLGLGLAGLGFARRKSH